MGWERYAYEALLTDYLILNRDRHGANMEVLRDQKNRQIKMAPLFDHGLSLLCTCHTEKEIRQYDVMEDKKVQSFLGSSSSLVNVRMVPKAFLKKLPKLGRSDLDPVFAGLDGIISETHIAKMREMIWERWCSLDRI